MSTTERSSGTQSSYQHKYERYTEEELAEMRKSSQLTSLNAKIKSNRKKNILLDTSKKIKQGKNIEDDYEFLEVIG